MQDAEERRIIVLRVFFILIFIIYSIKLFSMQILSGEIYLSRAQDISRRTFPIPAQRGEIFDRNFTEPLVRNHDSFAVSITPADVPRGSMDDVIDQLAIILNIPHEDIIARLPRQYLQLYQPVEIASNIPFTSIAILAEKKNTLPGVSWQIKPVRNYGNAGSLAHILGYVGDITRDELTTLYNLGYQQGDVIGKAGIEKQYDNLLRGKEGRETRTVDVRGRRISGRENNIITPPEMGRNIVLTIDAKLQELVEKALGERIGAAVVMRPGTGEILAMVSYPWYDPNIFTSAGRSAASEFRALADDPKKPFLNRVIQSAYPPASTFKIVLSTGVLAENAFPPEQTILCPGFIRYGGRDWYCHNRLGHGRVNLQRGLAYSCNIYYWTVGRDYLGTERMVSYAREYGFGELTGIDLPGEIAGFIPTPQWKERRFHERWVGGDTMNMAIGQGYTLVTPLQLANMVCMIVNNGKIYKPHLLKEVRDPVNNVIEYSHRPEVIHESAISESIYDVVRQDMRNVVSTGTAQYPLNMIKVTDVAAKTGQAEVGLYDRWHSWFVAYAPYNREDDENAIVVSVIIEASNEWEWWAPYATAVIFQGYYANQNFNEAVRTLGLGRLIQTQE